LPRQTRRTRNQAPSLRKGQQPAVPAHFYRRTPTPTVEPAPGGDALAGEPDVDSALGAQNAPARSAGAGPEPRGAAAPPRGRGAALQQSTRERLSHTDYGYVIGELKRIFTTAALIVLLLIVIAILRH